MFNTIYLKCHLQFDYSLTENQWTQIKQEYSSSANAQIFLSDYNPEDVGVVTLPTYSSSVWTIPPPERDAIIKELTKCKLGLLFLKNCCLFYSQFLSSLLPKRLDCL